MRRSRKYFVIVKITILILILSSCATATVYIDPLSKNYVNLPIVSPTGFFMGKKDITFSNYTLKLNKTIQENSAIPYRDEGGQYKTVTGGNYSFQINKIEKFNVEIIKKSDITAFSFNSGALSAIKAKGFINIYSDGNLLWEISVESDNSEILFEIKEPYPIKILKNKYSYQGGKKYKLWGYSLAGLDIYYDGQEYGIINLLNNQAFNLNTNFSKQLNEEETNFLSLIILASFEYYTSIDSQKPTKELREK